MLLYRGSKDGWKYKDFHDRCDGKGGTITLFKVKDNNKESFIFEMSYYIEH